MSATDARIERLVSAGTETPAAASSGDADPLSELRAQTEVTIPVLEERARIDKQAVETGRVRVRTHSETTEQVLRETLRRDAVGVSRVAINRTLTEGEEIPSIRTEDGVTVIPVLEEVVVVEKRLVLREEVRIRQTTSGEDVEVPVTLRRQRAVIERVAPNGTVTETSDSTEDT